MSGWRGISPIGIDFGARCVKIAQFRRAGRRLTLQAMVAPLPRDAGSDDEAAARVEAVRRMLDRGSFKGRQAVACATGDGVEYRNMRMNGLSGAALASAVHAGFASQLGLSDDAYETRFLDAGEVWEDDEARREVIAMGAPRDALLERLRLIERCGLTPIAIDALPGAAVRALSSASTASDDAPARVVLDIGYRTTVVSIAAHDRVRLVRRVDAGLRAIDEEAAEALGVTTDVAERIRIAIADGAEIDPSWPPAATSPEAAVLAFRAAASRQGQRLAPEIARCVQYHGVTFREGRPGAGVVLGGGAGETALLETLSEESGVAFHPVTSETGPEWIDMTRDLADGPSPSVVALAVGLARYGHADQARRAA